MSAFAAKYDSDQREAVARASLDDKVRPARRIREAAAAGELQLHGRKLPAFDIPESSVRQIVRREKLQRAGAVRSELAARPPRDAIETLRQRLVTWSDVELERLERAQRATTKTGDIAHFRQVIRAVREIAALPGPDDERTPAPGLGPMADRIGGETRKGPVADILRAHRASVSPAAPDAATERVNATTDKTAAEHATGDKRERSTQSADTSADGETRLEQDGPGAFVLERISRLPAVVDV